MIKRFNINILYFVANNDLMFNLVISECPLSDVY